MWIFRYNYHILGFIHNSKFLFVLSWKDGRPAERNENDSAALAARIEAKKKMKEAQTEQEQQVAEREKAKVAVQKKKSKKKDDSLDDLLSAGLSGSKKKK